MQLSKQLWRNRPAPGPLAQDLIRLSPTGAKFTAPLLAPSAPLPHCQDVVSSDPRLDKKGVTIFEYALIAGLISVVAIALLNAIGTSVSKIYSSINDALSSA